MKSANKNNSVKDLNKDSNINPEDLTLENEDYRYFLDIDKEMEMKSIELTVKGII